MILSEQIFNEFKLGIFNGFYKEVYPSLLTYAVRCLTSTYGYLAEDCVQDSIYQAFRKSNDFHSVAQLKSFLYICIHNGAVSYQRKYNSQKNYVLEQNHFEDDISHTIIEQETMDLLYDALQYLPNDLRQVFHLSFERGMKNAEVGKLMGISESGAKKKKAKMIQLLRERFSGNEKILVLIAILSSITKM